MNKPVSIPLTAAALMAALVLASAVPVSAATRGNHTDAGAVSDASLSRGREY